MTPQLTRRALVGASVLAGMGARELGEKGISAAPMAIQERSTAVDEASTPPWRFVLHIFEDPYRGTILQPVDPQPGMRYVGAEVGIVNESDAALNFSPSSIRLRDAEGVEYPSVGVVGSDARILDINLIPGERARGWVWFAVPEEAELTELTYVAPSPRLSVPLAPDSDEDTESATPVSG